MVNGVSRKPNPVKPELNHRKVQYFARHCSMFEFIADSLTTV